MRIPNKELLSDGAEQMGFNFFSIGVGNLKGSSRNLKGTLSR